MILTSLCSSVAEAFYKDIPGSQLVSRSELSGEVWQLPCDKEVNITFKFGGMSFPVHPLDANIDLNLTDSSGNHVCFGAVCFETLHLCPHSTVADCNHV